MGARTFLAIFALIGLLAGVPDGARADGILLIDRQKVLSESAPAQRLRAAEQERRIALRAELDEIQDGLEAEEAEISDLRGTADAATFEARVKAFDTHVRDARRRSQAMGEALQAEFERARQRLVAALSPVLLALLEKYDADVIVDVRSVLAARPGLDVTNEAIFRLNATTTDLFLGMETPKP